MNFLFAFLIGGSICLIAQIIMDLFNLTPGVITALFVSLGAILEFFDLYDKLIQIGGAGALLPITSFGHTLAHFAYQEAINSNFLGLFSGMLKGVSSGITLAIILSALVPLFFKSKD